MSSATGPVAAEAEAQAAALVRAGDFDGAHALLKGATPVVGVRIISAIFSARVDGGQEGVTGYAVEAATSEMLRTCDACGCKPSMPMYNHALAALSRHAPPEAVLSWTARMRHAGVPLDLIACNMQLKAHAAMGDLRAATRLLTGMLRAADAPAPPPGTAAAAAQLPPPDEVSFNTVIAALAHARKPGEAEALLIQMLDLGLHRPSTVTFTSVITGFALSSQPERATKWLRRMLDARIMPDARAFNGVLAAYANVADGAGARAVFALFLAHARDECPNAAPDLVTYNTLISACARANEPIEAERAFEQLRQVRSQPEIAARNAVAGTRCPSQYPPPRGRLASLPTASPTRPSCTPTPSAATARPHSAGSTRWSSRGCSRTPSRSTRCATRMRRRATPTPRYACSSRCERRASRRRRRRTQSSYQRS